MPELDLRNAYHVSVLAIRCGDTVDANPRAEVELESGDIMVIIGRLEAVNRIAALA